MDSTTSEFAAFLRQMSSLGISPQQIQAAVQLEGPRVFQELLTEIQSTSSIATNPADQLFSDESIEKDIKRIQATATIENKLGPGPVPPVPFRFQSIHSAFHSRRKFEETIDLAKRRSKGSTVRTAYVGTEKYFSETPLCDLDRIAFGDMLVRKVHRGRYLMCRVVAPPTRVVAVELTTEDPEGDVLLVSLYNFPSMINAGTEELDAIFHVGTTLAIREPYRKMSLQGENSFIRVDSPSDVIFLNPNSTLLKNITWRFGSHAQGTPNLPTTVSGWKELGNKHFNHSRWFCAAVAYTKGLRIDPGSVVLRANRAEAYLRLKYYSAALSDAERVLECLDIPDAVRRKAQFRAGKAEYGRGNFNVAIGHFKVMSEDSLTREWIHRANTRISETKLGQYDWLRLFLDSQNAASTLDVADFVGPIQVDSLSNRGGGRGVVATRDIRVGELLVVAKPFACAFKRDLPPGDITLSLNMITKKMGGGCDGMTLSRIVEKFHGNPELSDLVYHLCPGPPYFSPPLQSYPPPTTGSLLFQHPLEFGVDINMALLENIFSNNQFSPQPLRYADFKQSGSDELDRMTSPSALYALPSLFNHACAANSFRVFFGEVMVIRASARIIQGEEITISYIGGTTATNRQKQLDNWHFRCTCWLCEEERADGERACQDREELMDRMDRIKGPEKRARTETSIASINKLKRLIQRVSRTHAPSHSAVCPLLTQLQHRLSTELQQSARGVPSLFYQAVAEEIKALEASGVSVTDKSVDGPINQPHNSLPISMDRCPVQDTPESCVLMMLTNAGSFMCLGDAARATRWLRAAWWLDGMTGGGRPLFEERYKNILSGTGLDMLSNTIPT